MNAYELLRVAPKKTGASVMPIVLTPDNKWMQDTRDMIEYFERKYPSPSVFPQKTELLFLSNLLEAWGDEYWVPFAMHYRWRYPENVEFFRKEAGDNFMPVFVPRFIKKPFIDRTVNVLTNFLPSVGDRPEQFELIEKWTEDMLTKLNIHFETSPYLLGEAATNADFGLAGPLVAHLCRDPYTKRELMGKYNHVSDWATRIEKIPHQGKTVQEKTVISPTLLPILQSIFQEFIPMIDSTVSQMKEFEQSPKYKHGKTFPRRLGEIEHPFLNGEFRFKKRALPFNAWKMQKVMNVYHSSKDSKEAIDHFLKLNSLPTEGLSQLKIPKLERSALKVYSVPHQN